MSALRSALRLEQQYSVATLGQDTIFPGAAMCNGNTVAQLQDPAAVVACLSPTLMA